MAKTDKLFSISGLMSLLTCISSSNSFSIKLFARNASSGLTAKVILCSEEDCVIKTTLICSLANKVNNRPLNPDFPIMPEPLKLMTDISPIEEIPFIGNVVFPLSN
ncbi:hypothetical protein D3C86_1416800 [compost metagenome]